jgi:hypothetical protein
MGEITAIVNQYESEGKAEETYQLYKLRILVLNQIQPQRLASF